MKKALALALTAALIIGAAACGGKKKKEEKQAEAAKAAAFKLGECPAARIDITPSLADQQQCSIGSNCEIALAAAAYDKSGKSIDVPLTWGFRGPDGDDIKTAGGHQITSSGGKNAVFKASGMAPGNYIVMAEDTTCNLGSADEKQYVTGEARVVVHHKPGAPAACGRIRVSYGDDVDRMGDKVLASQKITLIAELSGKEKMPRGYKVRFYINDKAFSSKQPIHFMPSVAIADGYQKGYRSFLPIYMVPGNYRVRYELLNKDQVECSSQTGRFSAK